MKNSTSEKDIQKANGCIRTVPSDWILRFLSSASSLNLLRRLKCSGSTVHARRLRVAGSVGRNCGGRSSRRPFEAP